MNKEQRPALVAAFLGWFGGRFAPRTVTRQAGKTRVFPSNPGRKIARRKVLKTERLQVVHFGPEWPFFQGGRGRVQKGNTLGHITRR
jgi:hypothetical protein